MPGQEPIDNPLARSAYARGTDPITYAEYQITALIEVHILAHASTACLDNPAAYLGYSELTIEALARKILGDLLDARMDVPRWCRRPSV